MLAFGGLHGDLLQMFARHHALISHPSKRDAIPGRAKRSLTSPTKGQGKRGWHTRLPTPSFAVNSSTAPQASQEMKGLVCPCRYDCLAGRAQIVRRFDCRFRRHKGNLACSLSQLSSGLLVLVLFITEHKARSRRELEALEAQGGLPCSRWRL